MDYEAQRRIAVLCSHLCPSHFNSRNTHIVSTSNCSSESTTAQVQTRDLVKSPNSQDTCIFCQIIRGNSPAFKVIAAMCSKIPFISNAIKKATGCDSFNLVVNNGAAAGQVIFHSLRRLSVKLDEEAPHLVESIREHLLLAKNEEECKDQGSALAGNCRG
uniref:Uncharacterized protein n=1 Tax=Chenopodium quinoa TaxID=63459 RepID=A0A803KQ71_CHEQI